MSDPKRATIAPAELETLVRVLREGGYLVVGPTVRDGAIVYEELESADELPVGWTDRQDGGTYRLERREDEARFGYAVGPHSWKRLRRITGRTATSSWLFPRTTQLRPRDAFVMSESSITKSEAARTWMVFFWPVEPPVPSTATPASREPLAPLRTTIVPTSTARSSG